MNARWGEKCPISFKFYLAFLLAFILAFYLASGIILTFFMVYCQIFSNIVQHLPPLFLASKSKRFTWLETRLSLVVLVFGRFAGFVWLGCWLMLVAVVLFDFLLHACAVVCIVLLLAWLHVPTSPAPTSQKNNEILSCRMPLETLVISHNIIPLQGQK